MIKFKLLHVHQKAIENENFNLINYVLWNKIKVLSHYYYYFLIVFVFKDLQDLRSIWLWNWIWAQHNLINFRKFLLTFDMFPIRSSHFQNVHIFHVSMSEALPENGRHELILIKKIEEIGTWTENINKNMT